MSQDLTYDTLSDAATGSYGPISYGVHLYVDLPDYNAGVASAPTDSVAPTVTAVTPVGFLDRAAEVVIDIDDDIAVGYAGVFVSFNGLPKQAIYRRGAFEPGFASLSAVESLNGGKKQRLHIRPDSRWPNGTIAITVDPIDSSGNLGAA